MMGSPMMTAGLPGWWLAVVGAGILGGLGVWIALNQRHRTPPPQPPAKPSPEQTPLSIAQERFAEGRISQEEFASIVETLLRSNEDTHR